MKRVLITGEKSYIGNSVADYIRKNYPGEIQIDKISLRGNEWITNDFGKYDSIFHVAGIAHSDVGKVSDEIKKKYYKVNTKLTVEVAKKAKEDGCRQFIFMSSAIVYGDSSPIGKEKIITADTPVSPANFYGDSKVQAEKGLNELNSGNFKVCILRPPMIYGPGCKGNYVQLSKLAKKLPIFPDVKNTRSMLLIWNLAEFVSLMIINEESGIFWPQNSEYSNTSRLVKEIASANGKNIRLIRGFTWLLKLFSHISGLVNKAFGNLTYDQTMSLYSTEYRKFDLEESIKITESFLK